MNQERPVLPVTIPGFVYPLLFVAGPLPLWPFARSLSTFTRVGIFPFPYLMFALPFLLSWNWLLLASTLAAGNGLFALLFSLLHPPYRMAASDSLKPVKSGNRFRESLSMIVCGLPFGLILVSVEQWLTDVLWSGFYPVNASIESISYEVGSAWMLFAAVFAFTAFYVSSGVGTVTPVRVLKLLLGTFLAYCAVHQLYLLIVAIPEWQTEIREIFPPWVIELREAAFHLLIYAGVPVTLGSLFLSHRNSRPFREFFAGLMSVALALVMMAWVSGMPIHYALLLGQRAEKIGRPNDAIPWYSRALTWSHSDKLKSYLQFRVGLLYRKTGHLEEARDAFTRVLVRYPQDETLLDDADEFKEKLAAGKATSGQRVVIPGIEARTEYKSAYCVPNSLGLLLNFWGDRSGAKRIGSEITQLDRGSLITDEVYYAESRGFVSLVVPLCNLEQMHRLVDAGIPMLAFIPGHVIAVFGYDKALGTLVTYDVSTFDIWDDERVNHFAADWSLTCNTLGIVVPKNLLSKVRAVLGTDVEKRSESYLHYLMAQLVETNPDLRLSHLRRSQGHGFFPASWEYRAMAGDTSGVTFEDSTAKSFLLGHETDEQTPFIFAMDEIWRHHPDSAFSFLKELGERKPLTPALVTALAGSGLRNGKAADAGEILLHSVAFDKMEPAAAAFLLRRAPMENDAVDWVGRLSTEVLNRNELHGDEARLAYQTWRALGAQGSNLDEALQQIHSYLDRWSPYDTTAIGDLWDALKRKTFRPNEETDERVWKKQSRVLDVRRARLQWANGG